MNIIAKFFGQAKVQALILLLLSISFILSLCSYELSDPSWNLITYKDPENLLDYFGAYLSDILYQICGLSAFIIPICFAVWSYLLYQYGQIHWYFLKTIFMILAIVGFSLFLNRFDFPTLPANAGGALGQCLHPYISQFGLISTLLSLISGMSFIILSIGFKFSTIVKSIIYLFELPTNIFKAREVAQIITNRLNSLNIGTAYSPEVGSFGNILPEPTSKTFSEPIEIAAIEKKEKFPPSIEAPSDFFKQVAAVEKKIVTPRPSYISSAKLTSANEGSFIPSFDLLDEADSLKITPQSNAELSDKATELLEVLGDFGVKGKIIDIRQGPVVTMYEFEPSAGTKSSRVIGLSDDIARSLSAISTRIAVIPGRNVLGIELPNKQRAFFRLKELLQTKEFQDPNILLPIVLGKDLGGQPLVADLAKMPHVLVAGTTGSGKSVAINTMIMSLLYRYTSEECKMIMIDPKMLELSAYDNIPHLITPVVTEPGKAVVALKWAVKEMENRYRLMSHLGVRNIANYNRKIVEAIADEQPISRKIQTGFDSETGKPTYDEVPIEMKKMPFIVVIVDEMADLMLVAGKDIESSIQRLAQMARAAGIHIIMATQRPSVDVITGVIKANFPSRISFKVTSKIDSRTILGEQGAEQLLGLGDMLYMGNSSRILRVHGPFVDDKEVEKVTDFLRSIGFPEYISEVTESTEDEFDPDDFGTSSGGEEIYKQAVNIVRTERKTSISYIQRSLRIGYNRAANIVEEMERNGILSSPNPAGKREILLPDN